MFSITLIFAVVFFCPLSATQWASGPDVDDQGPYKLSNGGTVVCQAADTNPRLL